MLKFLMVKALKEMTKHYCLVFGFRNEKQVLIFQKSQLRN